MRIKADFHKLIVAAIIGVAIWISPDRAAAHCDTLAGPVVSTAKAALEKGDVTSLLKWVKKENETEIKEAFLFTDKDGKPIACPQFPTK